MQQPQQRILANQLQSARIAFRPLQPDDWPFFLALHQHPEVMRWVGTALSEQQIAEKFTSRLNPDTEGGQGWLMSHATNQQRLGLIGFKYTELPCGSVEIGYLLDPNHQGLGYGKEAVQYLCAEVERNTTVSEITALVAEPNIASQRLLQRCGFLLTGRQSNGFQTSTDCVDDLVYRQSFGNIG